MTAPVTLPREPGHCDSDDAWVEFVRQYDGQPRTRPDLSDFALANAVFMASRHDLDLIVYQTAAKERIRWLSIELAKARQALAAPERREPTREEIARAIDPQTFDLIEHYNGIDNKPKGEAPEVSTFRAYPSLRENRDLAFAKADAIRALFRGGAE